MWIILIAMIGTIHFYNRQCFGINFIDLPGFGSQSDTDGSGETGRTLKQASDDEDEVFRRQQSSEVSEEQTSIEHSVYPPVRAVRVRSTKPKSLNFRRHWLVSAAPTEATTKNTADKDENLKSKIDMLVQQTMHDTEIKMKTVQKLKEAHHDKPSYRVGFILSMIKKSRDVLNELFNVAVKHRDEWKALEQLKIFELIVHTNVDTTNLVRQLVEIHIMNLNSSSTRSRDKMLRGGPLNLKSRVVLL